MDTKRREQLFEQALKETGSLTEAMQLVQNVERFLNGTVPLPPTTSAVVFKQAPPVVNAVVVDSDKKYLRGYRSRRWKPAEKAMAEAMFNQGKDLKSVADATDRSIKAISNALCTGVIKPAVDPRRASRRAGSYKSVIARGQNPRDFELAQGLIDKKD